MREKLEKMKEEALAALAAADSRSAVDAVRLKYLGRKGAMRSVISSLKKAPAAERPALGKLANEIKQILAGAVSSRLKEIADSLPTAPSLLPRDLSLPGAVRETGRMHPISATIREAVALFERLGFSVAEGPEVELERRNFDMLNIPAEHPSHDPFDTFYIETDPPREKASQSDKLLLRSHTSPVQIRVLEKRRPPVRIVAPGRTFRPDTVDATHFHTFHQIEGLAVEEGITFADLKGTLALFAEGMFGAETKTRFRPSFFPFTEPSAEMDISCIFCEGKETSEGSICPVCKSTGWIELLGCGMVHPAVLEGVGIDPDVYSGFAFGMGVERICMLRFGIDDIRLFISADKGNDMRFLRQVG